MRIFLGADHKGFEMKEEIEKWLSDQGYDVEDCGAQFLDHDDDYVDFAARVGNKVATTDEGLGIVLCGSGVGVSIAANKVQGIRSGLCFSSSHARSARKDDNINVLALGSDITPIDTAKEIILTFITTPYTREERFERRITKLSQLESHE